MKYVKYELYKLFGVRYVWIFLAVMLALNVTLCAYQISEHQQYLRVPSDVLADFFDLYSRDRESVDADHAEYERMQAERERLLSEAMERGDFEIELEPLPNVYSDSADYTDAMLYTMLYSQIENNASYPRETTKVLERARTNLYEFDCMGISHDTFMYRYQEKTIALYENAQSHVRIGFEYLRGWDEYFDYGAVDVFILTVILMVGTVVFTSESSAGVLPIIKITRRGRAATAAAKTAATAVVTVAVVVIFTMSTWLTAGAKIGYSSPYNAIQAYPAFLMSPYVLSVGEYFAVTVAVKTIVSLAFALAVLASSAFFDSYAYTYAFGLGMIGLNYLFNSLPYGTSDVSLRYLNLISAMNVSPLFERYRALNMFGMPIGYVQFMLVLLVIIIAASSIIFTLKYACSTVTRTFGALSSDRIKPMLARILQRHSEQPRRAVKAEFTGIYASETYKLLISSHLLPLILALLAVKCVISYNSYTPIVSYSDAVYKEYMTVFAGELTDKKRTDIERIRAELDGTIMRYGEMQTAYADGGLGYDEYREYLNSYYDAKSKSELFTAVEAHADYIDEKFADSGVNAQFVYDTGWRALFGTGFDFTLYALILICMSGVFASEHKSDSSSGGFAQILRTTRRGRGRTFACKLASAAVMSCIMAIIWNAVDIVIIARSYELPLSSAPAASIERFGDIDSSVTIMQLLAAIYIVRVFAAVILAVFVGALSEVTKKNIAAISVTAAVTLLPDLLASFGADALASFGAIRLFRAAPLILQSASGSPEWLYAAVFTAAASSVAGAAVIFASKSWNKTG